MVKQKINNKEKARIFLGVDDLMIYRDVVEEMPESICRFKPGGILSFVNKSCCKYFNKKCDNLVGKSFYSLIPLKDRGVIKQTIVSLSKKKPSITYKYQAIAPNGETRWQEWTNQAIFDKKTGKIIEYQSIGRDITKQKEEKEGLVKSEKKFKDLVENVSDWIWEVDTKGVYTYVSPKVKNILGYESKEIVGKTPFDFMPKEEAKRVAVIFGDSIKRKKPIEVLENKNLHKDGSIIILQTSGQPIFNQEGNFIGYIGVDRDITRQKEVEDELKKVHDELAQLFEEKTIKFKKVREEQEKQKEHFQVLFESSRDAIMILEPPTWAFTSCNLSTVKMFACKDEKDFISYPPWKLSPPEQPDGISSADKAKAMIMEAVEKGSNFFEWTHRRKNGEDFPATILMTRMTVGDKTFLQATVRDITERKKIEEDLKESEKRLRIVAKMSTDFIYEWNIKTGRLEWLGDIDKKFGYFNGKFPRTFRAWISTIYSKDRLVVEKQIKKQVKIGGLVDVAYRIKGELGKWYYWTNRGWVLLDNKGYPYKMIGVCIDVTKQKEINENLIKEKKWTETVVQLAPNIVIGLGRKSKILMFNKFAERLTGYKADEVIGKNWIELFVSKEQRKGMYDVWDLIFKNEFIEHHYTNPIQIKNGNQRTIAWNNTLIKEDGKFKMVLSIGEDITDRVIAEIALKKSESRYRDIVENAPVMIHSVDNNGKIIFINNMGCLVLGYSKEEVKGLHIREIYSSDLWKDVQKGFEKLKIKGSKFVSLGKMIKKNGEEIDVEIDSIAIYDDNGVFVRTRSIIRDITQAKKIGDMLQEKIEQMELMGRLNLKRHKKVLLLEKENKRLKELLKLKN